MAEETQPKKKSNFKTLFIVLGVILVFMMALAFLSSSPADVGERVKQLSALDQMEMVFEGTYTRYQIQRELDTAMGLYNVEINEENYNTTGSVLVALRKEFNVQEMDILDFMIDMHVEGVNLSFPDAAGLAVGSILAQ